MLIGTIKNRVWALSSTEGVGSYESDGPKAGYQDINVIGNSIRSMWLATDDIDWEVFYGTITISGSTYTLSRDEIVASSNDNAEVSWSSGVRNIVNIITAEDVVVRNRKNTFQTDQDMDGFKLILSADAATYVWSPGSGQSQFVCGTTGTFTFSSGGNLTVEYSDNGSGVGPQVIGKRTSVSPAALDQIALFLAVGKDSGGNDQNYGGLRFHIDSPTSGAEMGKATLEVAKNGALLQGVEVGSDYVRFGSGTFTHNYYWGRAGGDTDSNVIGMGFFTTTSTPTLAVRGADNLPFIVGRSTDGTLASFRVAGTQQGSVSISGATTSYNAFSSSHWAWWGNGFEPETEPALGTLLSLLEEDYVAIDGVRSRMGNVKITDKANDKAVYGTFNGYVEDEFVMSRKDYEAETARRPHLLRQITKVKPVKVDRYVPLVGADGKPVTREDGSVVTQPVKVTTDNVRVKFRRIIVSAGGLAPHGIRLKGKIELGDPIVSSDEPGVGVAAPEGTDMRYILAWAGATKPDTATRNVRARFAKS